MDKLQLLANIEKNIVNVYGKKQMWQATFLQIMPLL